MNTTPEKKIAEIKKDISVIEKKSQKIAIIKSEKDIKLATEFLAQAKARADRVEEIRLSFTKPINEGLRAINTMYKEPYNLLNELISKVKRAIGDYRMEEERKAMIEEERQEKLREAKNKRREEKGKELDSAPVPIVERPQATVRSESGQTTTIKVWKFQVEAYSKLPKNVVDEILYQANQRGLVDMVIRKMVNDGVRKIEGVKIYEDVEIRIGK